MELNLSLGRLAILAACVGLFVLLGGFSMAELQDPADAIRVGKAWRYCVMLYMAGAICISVVDHSVGNLDRTNLRFFYVLLGIALMAVGGWWLHSLKGAVTKTAALEEKGGHSLPRLGGIASNTLVPAGSQGSYCGGRAAT